VNQGESAATVRQYLQAKQPDLANVMLDAGKELGRQMDSTALPTTLFYDALGRLVDTHLGALSSATLASKLEKLGSSGPGQTGATAR
jgi:hypothetical protein